MQKPRFLLSPHRHVLLRLIPQARRQLIILLIILKQLCRNRRQDLVLSTVFLGLLQFSKNVLKHLRLSIVLLLNGLKSFEAIFSNIEGFGSVESLFPALLFEVSPLRFYTFFELFCRPQDVYPNIVLLAIGDKKFEVVFDLIGVLVLRSFEFFYDAGDVNRVLNLLIVVR